MILQNRKKVVYKMIKSGDLLSMLPLLFKHQVQTLLITLPH